MTSVLYTAALQLLLVAVATALDSVTLCYDWNSIPQLSLRCQQQTRIRILSLGVARKLKIVGSNPYPSGQCNAASDTDCVAYYPSNERDVFQQCNFRQNCDVTLGFEANPECNQLGFTGQNYFHFTYECIPEFYDTWTAVLFLEAYDGNPALTSVSGHSQLHLTSTSYPDYVTASRVVCQLTLGAYSRLRVRTGELRAHRQIAESMQCPYRLYISDSLTHHAQCAKTLWRDDLSPDIVFTNTEAHNVSVQIALESTEVKQSAGAQQTPPSGSQVKFWLMLYTYSTASNLEPNQGLKSITCDSNQPIWRPPTTSSPPTTTTQSTTTLEPVTSSTVRQPISTTDSVNGSSTTESGAEGKAQQQKRRSLTSRYLPVIAGVVAGGVVVIILIIVCVAVCVRQCNRDNSPPKSLEVIDAWDDVSTLDPGNHASKISAHSNGSVQLSNGSSGFYDRSSPDTSDSTVGHNDDDNHSDGREGEFSHTIEPQTEFDETLAHDIYAEIPEPPGVRAQSNSSKGLKGYIFEDDLYSENKRSSKVLVTGNGAFHASLDRKRLSELYAKPMKKKKHSSGGGGRGGRGGRGGFDNPALSGDLYETAHRLQLAASNEDLYGYSTSLA